MNGVPSSPQLTGIVLAGGRGRRMGGRDKGLVELAGRPMVCHVLDALRPQVRTLLINANRNAEHYGAFGCKVIADADDTYQGPLAGMLSGLRATTTPYAVFAPCDAPLTPADLAPRLVAALQRERAEIAVAFDGERVQPVFCLLASALADSIEQFLMRGERKIDLWFAEHRVAQAEFSQDAEVFANINSPDELAHAAQRLSEL